MKVAFKGKFIKNTTFDKIISTLKLNDTLMFIGTPEESQVKMPIEFTKFKEDLTDAERAEIYKDADNTLTDYPAGLVNLGNTCYAASVFQMLKRVPELTDVIYNFNDNSPNKENRLISDIKNTFSDMNANTNGSVQPIRLMMTMLENIPQFQDLKTQQDAEECFSCMYNAFMRTSSRDQISQLFE
mmetsp:Transcript_53511/g.44924  ORF Transcript_53511/g.44924 Transcript_53511/m.44924 type:complete len:185 (+) Transcript_53511:118-672(+)